MQAEALVLQPAYGYHTKIENKTYIKRKQNKMDIKKHKSNNYNVTDRNK